MGAETRTGIAPRWMSRALLLAAALDVLWGMAVVAFPLAFFEWWDVAPPRYPQLWQGIGVAVGVYGVGYALAAGSPLTHWPIVLVGLLGKVFGPVGFLLASPEGVLPWGVGWMILANGLIWWVPFGMILHRVYRVYVEEPLADGGSGLPDALTAVRSQKGQSLAELCGASPALVVFLRHFGCTFCREALSDLSEKRSGIESAGTRLVLVHMAEDDAKAADVFARYGLEDVDRISDPTRKLYRALGLRRGRLGQLFGLRVWWRGFRAGVLDGHGLGWPDADGFQMPGAFLLYEGRVARAFRHRNASDRPDYEDLARCEADNSRMKRDLEVAARVQQTLLPKSLPEVAGVRFSWALEPTEELAGDTLNVMRLDDDHVALYVLDVSGHGVPSALLSVTLNHWLSPDRGQSELFGPTDGVRDEVVPPAQVAEKLNRQFPMDLETAQYFTILYGVLNTRTRVFRYVTAGHPGPVYVPRNSEPVHLSPGGLPVGMFPAPDYSEHTLELKPGDRLYVYSDGAIEAMTGAGEEFGVHRLAAHLDACRDRDLAASVSTLVDRVKQWRGDSPYKDDISVLSVEIEANVPCSGSLEH